MNLVYLANARMPSEKAHGIQIAKTCEAFIALGIPLTLVVPRRATVSKSVKDFYGLAQDIPLVRLSVADTYRYGKLGFYFGSLTFTLSSLLYLRKRARQGEQFVIYTVDMDAFSGALLRFVGRPYFSEMHAPKRPGFVTRLFMGKVHGVIVINSLLATQLQKAFNISSEQILIEPNGVDIKAFSAEISKTEAREQLGLQAGSLALYVGRMYPWKGLGILAEACSLIPHVTCLVVGGTKEQYLAATEVQALPQNLQFAGDQPPASIPQWQAAADALLVLGTARNDDSYRYTAPMKIFEYFASRRPVIASRTPALSELVGEVPVSWYQPDDAQGLAAAIVQALDQNEAALKAALEAARTHDWLSRAQRIRAFLKI